MKTGIELISEERQRQFNVKGYDANHNTDDVEMDEVAQGVLASLKYFIDTLEVKED